MIADSSPWGERSRQGRPLALAAIAERRVDFGSASPFPVEDEARRRRRAATDGRCSYAALDLRAPSRFFGLAAGFVFRRDGIGVLDLR